jgi:hypothetical protein
MHGTGPEGLHGCAHLGVTGQHDDRPIGTLGPKPLKKLETTHSGHSDVKNDTPRLKILEPSQKIGRRTKNLRGETYRPRGTGDRPGNGKIIIDDIKS